MVDRFDFEQLARPHQVPRHADVGFTRGGIAAGVIVLCEAWTYVQRRAFRTTGRVRRALANRWPDTPIPAMIRSPSAVPQCVGRG